MKIKNYLSKLNWHAFLLFLCVFGLAFVPNSFGQKNKKSTASAANTLNFPEALYDGLHWRNIGPYRGGRSATVTGVPGKPNLFYFGATGGGVWRTQDGGATWHNISDGFFGGSIGAVAVSEYDNNVIYVGGGEKTVRGNVSYGYGMWKSVDAGKTWSHIGLKNSRHIGRIRIHPKNPDLVYVAVMGDLYKSNEERGVYRSKDGGKNWERVLFANADAGAVDLILDPTNPRIMYATTWRVRRNPYNLSSGGEGSGIWKSTDGGDTWTNISENEGLPKGALGIIGVAVSPVNGNKVWALIEANEGGVYRSEDGGETWKKFNEDRSLRQRAWYYTRIYADTQDEDVVYVMNVSYHKSTDGGRTFKSYNAPHGDHHDLWIAPEDPNRMIIADDGGAQVTFDGGQNWSTYHNQPTAQFYRLTTDNHFPYRIYAAQQDNSTIRIAHRTNGGNIGESDWEPTAGGESAHIAVDPENPEIVYGGSYGGFLTRVDHSREEIRGINVWPDNPMGYGAEGMKYRFQWNFPLLFSPHNAKKLYTGSNHLHVTYNEGQSWEIISPDLTRNDPARLGPSGGPITKDNTGVEYYCTIFAIAESPLKEDLIWVGSDDGLLHVTKDGGKNWENVTPPGMPEWIMINSIDPNPFVEGGAYVAATMYKSGDYQPYLYKTEDYGKTWTKITSGIDKEHFTRVVRADPGRKGLLYAGTETGMYVSFDDGASWKPFQLNLPIVPITDLAIKQNNLIAATQGRSIWMIDDLTPLHQLNQDLVSKAAHLYQPVPSYRMDGYASANTVTAGENHPGGVMVHYYLKDEPDSAANISLTFMEEDGKEIVTFSTDSKKPKFQLKDVKAGMNRFVWNTRYPDAEDFEGMILWWSSMNGPKAVPGKYQVKMSFNGQEMVQPFEILPDPRSAASIADMKAQFEFLVKVRDKVTEAHQTIKAIREARKQMDMVTDKVAGDSTMKDLMDVAKEIKEQMKEIEEALYQTKNRSNQDPLNFPIKLTNKLAHLNSLSGIGNFGPTAQAEAFRKEVTASIDAEIAKWENVKKQHVPKFNQMVKDKQLDAVSLK